MITAVLAGWAALLLLLMRLRVARAAEMVLINMVGVLLTKAQSGRFGRLNRQTDKRSFFHTALSDSGHRRSRRNHFAERRNTTETRIGFDAGRSSNGVGHVGHDHQRHLSGICQEFDVRVEGRRGLIVEVDDTHRILICRQRRPARGSLGAG
jgi:hypothetical protein